jgi:hypothetical protein
VGPPEFFLNISSVTSICVCPWGHGNCWQ